MKIFFTILFAMVCLNVYSQTNKSISGKGKNTKTKIHQKTLKDPLDTAGTPSVQPRETITDKYLKGPERKDSVSGAALTESTDKSPFAGGIYKSENAGKKIDSVAANTNARTSTNTNAASANPSNAAVALAPDTAYNQNTVVQNGITTTSGAVDKSGQAQFGQTNWGKNRSTIGESQWTVPPPVSASFIKEFPAANAATWTRNPQDSSIYSARYKSGVTWITSNYNAHGERLDMRTEMPLPQSSRPVSIFLAKQTADLQVTIVSRLQIQGKPDMYEIQTKTGKTIYINNDGVEVNY